MSSPGGQSLLMDTGWPGFNHRDADRIAAAAKKAGIKQIDYLLITHYHRDHVGGVQALARNMPIGNFIDHGPQTETGKDAEILFNEYSTLRDRGNHIVVKPGEHHPHQGAGREGALRGRQTIGAPLPGAGQPNPECAGYARPPPTRARTGNR